MKENVAQPCKQYMLKTKKIQILMANSPGSQAHQGVHLEAAWLETVCQLSDGVSQCKSSVLTGKRAAQSKNKDGNSATLIKFNI